MAERKSGPVKPPTIELEAKGEQSRTDQSKDTAKAEADKAGTSKAGTRPSAAKSTPGGKPSTGTGPAAKGKSGPDKADGSRSARAGVPAGPLIVAGVGGAVLGLALSYGLASAGLWPSAGAAEVAALSSRVSALEQSTAKNGSALSGLSGRIDALQSSTAARISELSKSTDTLKGDLNSRPKVDLGPIETRISNLSDRINAVAAGASSADAKALSSGLSDARTEVATLSDKVTSLSDEVASLSKASQSVKADVAALKARPVPSADAAAAQAVRLPMAISALEAALDNGQPYATALQSLAAAEPGLSVPDAVRAGAQDGLARPDAVAANLHAAIPAILAAAPVPKDSGWQQVAFDKLKSLLAIRPAGPVTGDTPDALVAQIEAAVGRRDFATARTLFDKLPGPMQGAAGDLPRTIGTLADAYGIVTSARKAALAEAGGAGK